MKYKAIIFDMNGTILYLERFQQAEPLNTLPSRDAFMVDGFLAFHEKAKKHNLKMAIATNTSSGRIAVINPIVSLDALFGEHIYTTSHVAQAKPSPDIYLHAAAQLNVAPHECIAVEDTHKGLRAAREAGMFCIGINTGNQPEHLALAHLKIDHYDEIDLETLLKEISIKDAE